MTTTPRLEDLQNLTDAELMQSATFAIHRERDAQLAVLYHLNEIERRRLHLKCAYASLYDYAKERLGYSSGAAHRRIASARALQKHPCVHEALKTGRLTLTTASTLAGVLKDLTYLQLDELVQKASGKSQEEVQALVAALRPQPKVRERIVPIAVSRPKTPDDTPAPSARMDAPRSRAEIPPAIPTPVEASVSTGPSHQPDPSAETVVEVVHRVQFSMTSATREKFETARDLLAGRFPAGPSIEQVFDTLLDEWLDRNDPQKRHERREKRRALREAATPTPDAPVEREPEAEEQPETLETKRSRHVPAALRDEIHVKGEGQCEFVAPNGKRCTATRGLEIEHCHPFARGGETNASNCRLFCPPHNQLSARNAFGDARIDRAIARSRAGVDAAVSTNGDGAPAS